MIRIDKGRPITSARKQRYPFASMAVGDSFFVLASDLPKSGASSLRSSARARGMRAAVRREGNGVRCWRVK